MQPGHGGISTAAGPNPQLSAFCIPYQTTRARRFCAVGDSLSSTPTTAIGNWHYPEASEGPRRIPVTELLRTKFARVELVCL
jgi:hypothetical protein